jgi:hypothetical protein
VHQTDLDNEPITPQGNRIPTGGWLALG